MPSMTKSLILLILLLLPAVGVLAQSVVVEGTVVDSKSEPLSGVVLRAYRAKKIIGHGTSGGSGEFRLRLAAARGDTVRLVASMIGYSKQELTLSDFTGKIRITLPESATLLKEVVVSAPVARQRGDTVSFRLGAFASRRDITLEDGLKKLPGIEVNQSGKISYLGRDISKFYVEGLNLAGSRYNQITRNLPSEYVTDVELIENFKEARVDSGRQSDDVAMNIRLSGKVRFRPVGTAEARAGLRHDDFIYNAAAAGMVFTPSFQTMLTLRAGTVARFAKDQAAPPASSLAASVTGNLSGSSPPLPADMYVHPSDRLVTLNSVKAFSKERSLNTGLSYAYSHTAYDYDSHSAYFTGDNSAPERFDEYYTPRRSLHRAGLSSDFMSNKARTLVSNRFSGLLDFQSGSLDALLSTGIPVAQSSRVRTWKLSDAFTLTFRRGSRRYSVNAAASYAATPSASVNIAGAPENSLTGLQTADSHRLDASLSTSLELLAGSCSSFLLPVDAAFKQEAIFTSWSRDNSVNDCRGTYGWVTLRPTYELVTPARRLELSAGAGVKLLMMTADNFSTDNSRSLNRIFFSPALRLAYNPTRNLSFILSGNYEETTGDIAELLTNKVVTSFRNAGARSGVIAHDKNLSGRLTSRYTNMLSLWFADMSLSASRTTRNTIASTDINPGGQVSTGVRTSDNTSDTYAASAGASKHISSIGLRLGLRGSCSYTRSDVIQQGRLMTGRNLLFSLAPSLTIAPVKWIELQCNSVFSRSASRFPSSKRTLSSWSNKCRLSVIASENVEIFSRADLISRKDEGTEYPDVCLLSLGANWRFRKFRLSLSADNILDKRSYYYTAFDYLNTYTYNFALLPRTITLSFTVTM